MKKLLKDFISFIKKIINNNFTEIIDACLIGVIAFIIFYQNFHYLSKFTLVGENNIIFGADTHDIAKLIWKDVFRTDMYKHLLFPFTLSPIRKIIKQVLTTSLIRSIIITFSCISALNVMGVFLLLKKLFLSNRFVLLFTGIYTFLFANLVLFSIPETYSLSNLFILIYLFILVYFQRQLNWRTCTILSIISAIAALYNPPLFSLIIIHLILSFFNSKFRDWILLAVSNLAIGLIIIFSSYYLLYRMEFVHFFTAYSEKHASLANFIDPEKIMTVIINFFFFSILSPVSHLPNQLGLRDLIAFLQSPIGILLFLFIFSIICFGIYFVLTQKSDNQRLLTSTLVWILIMVLFYIYFNPQEAILYSSQILLPLILIIANTFKVYKISPRLKYSLMILLFVILAIYNTLALYSGPII